MKRAYDLDGPFQNQQSWSIENGLKYIMKKQKITLEEAKKQIVNKNALDVRDIFGWDEKTRYDFWKHNGNLFNYGLTAPLREDAEFAMRYIKSHSQDGDEDIIITGRKFADEDSKFGKLQRKIVELKYRNIPFDRKIFCSEDCNKAELCNKFQIDVILEDKPENIRSIQENTNTDIIVFNTSYNKDCNGKNITRIYDFSQLPLALEKIREKRAKKVSLNEEIKPISGIPSIDKPYMQYYDITERELDFNSIKTNIYDYKKNLVMPIKNSIDFSYEGAEITFDQSDKKIIKFYKSLKTLGVKKGDVIALALPDCPEFMYIQNACSMIGAIVLPFHPFASTENIKDYMKLGNPKLLFMLPDTYENIKDIVDDTTLEKIILTPPNISFKLFKKVAYNGLVAMQRFVKRKDLVSKIKKVLKSKNIENKLNSFNEEIKGTSLLENLDKNKYIDFNTFIDLGKEYTGKIESNYEPNAPVLAILTSGTTPGKVKAALLTNENMNYIAEVYRKLIKYKVGDETLTILPFFHVFGNTQIYHFSSSAGMKNVVIPKFKAKNLFKICKEHKINNLVGVPTLLQAFVNCNKISNLQNLDGLSNVIIGGQAMNSKLINESYEFLGSVDSKAIIQSGYGLSESAGGVILTLTGSDKIKDGCIGIPVPGTNAKIVKPNTLEEANYDEIGELCVSGPSVMKGYLNDKESTDKVLKVHNDGKLWLHTGDLARMSKNGLIFYHGRLKLLIIKGGENIEPSEIENVIKSHDLVSECIVYGEKNNYYGEIPAAYIKLVSDFDDVTKDKILHEILNMCNEKLANFKVPSNYYIVKEIPKNLMGKPDYQNLESKSVKEKVLSL